MQTVDLRSSNLRSASYDDETQELTITFKSGSSYVYSDVSRNIFEGLTAAGSPGRYFADTIKDVFSTRRIG